MAAALATRGVLLRVGGAVALVLSTFNPTRWCYVRWATSGVEMLTPEKAIVGLLLLAVWILYVRAALNSIGLLGAGLIAAIIAAFVWLAVRQGWIDLGSTDLLTWIALVGLGLILGIGLTWSHFRRRITGQVDVDVSDDGL